MQDEAAYNAVGKSFRQALNMAMGTTRQISESLLDYQVCRSSPPSPRLPALASLPSPASSHVGVRTHGVGGLPGAVSACLARGLCLLVARGMRRALVIEGVWSRGCGGLNGPVLRLEPHALHVACGGRATRRACRECSSACTLSCALQGALSHSADVCVQLYMQMYTGTHSCMHACTHMRACMHDARASSRVAGTTFRVVGRC